MPCDCLDLLIKYYGVKLEKISPKDIEEMILEMLQTSIDANIYKKEVYELVQEYCNEGLGIMGIKEIGEFGTIYCQFEKEPKKAIKHLMKVKEGECINALYRNDIGFIDIVWGENDKNNKGFGLKHIIEKHGKEIKQLGFEVEDFIPIVVQFGNLNEKESDKCRKVYESKMFRFIVESKYKNSKKNWLLTAFDLRKKPPKFSGG
jgi:hypothetical protein